MAQRGVNVMDQASGTDFVLWRGDCVEVARGLPDNSLHYTIYSPPFESLYTFSDDPRDMSNCRDSATFWTHYRFLIAECFRATMPGRLVSIHCMDLMLSKLRDGNIGLRDLMTTIPPLPASLHLPEPCMAAPCEKPSLCRSLGFCRSRLGPSQKYQEWPSLIAKAYDRRLKSFGIARPM